MPPAALISSTAIFMPFETGTPQTLIGPDRSWWVPITISVAEMPSLVTLVWAAAGRWVSARALTARPNALNDFDIAVSSSWPVLSEGWGLVVLRRFRCVVQSRFRLRHRPF